MSSTKIENKSLIYTTLIDEVKKRINAFKSINIDMNEFENRLNNIINSIDKDHGAETYNTKNKVNTNNNELESYDNNIANLEMLIKDLKNYEEYYNISKKAKFLLNFLSDNEMVDYHYLKKEAQTLLDRVEKMPTDSYDNQKEAINNSYELVYNIMKLEALLGYDTIIERVKSDDVHSSCISKLIIEECNTSQNEILQSRLDYVQSGGMDSNILIDKTLLSMLAISKNEKYIDKMKKSIVEKYDEYKIKIEELKSTANNLETKVKEYKNSSKETKKDIARLLRRVSVATALIGVCGTLTINAYKWLDISDNLYLTHNYEHNLETGEITESNSWELFDKNNVLILEERPWELKENVYVKNTYYTRAPHKKGNDNPNDYVKLCEKKGQSIYTTETSTEEPEDFRNDKSKYSVIFREYTDVYLDGDLEPFWIFLILMLSIIMGFIYEGIYEGIFGNGNLSIGDILSELSDLNDDIESKKVKEKEMKENINKLNEMLKTCNNLYDYLKEKPYYSQLCPEIGNIIYDLNVEDVLNQYAPTADKKLVLKASHK